MSSLYWIADSTAINFSSPENWSTTSGGTPSYTVPDSGTDIFFDSSSGNCLFDTTVNVNNISLLSGYTGTVTQKSYSFISEGDVQISDGVFMCGSSSVEIKGTLTVE